MGGRRIKKVGILFLRTDLDAILNDLISAEIIDVAEPSLANAPELESSVTKEVINIEQYNANRDAITLLGTRHTFYMTGWIWVKSELEFVTLVSKYTCAWEVVDPTSEELSNAPIMLIRPQFLFGLYNGDRELFSLLSKNYDD